MTCKICRKRRPRRYCPGVEGGICAICCGEGREVTVTCPLSCPYLQEAHEREKPEPPASVPNPDVPLTPEFIRTHDTQLLLLSHGLTRAALSRGDLMDRDIHDALESLIRTYKTLQSGLLYESRPEGMPAAHVYDEMKKCFAEIRERVKPAQAEQFLNDRIVLGVLVFLQRLGLTHDNGRPKSRAFIDFLRRSLPPRLQPEPQPSSLIL